MGRINLDKVTPELMLLKIVNDYRNLMRYFGISPAQISTKDGKASFKLFSWPTLWSLCYLTAFITDSCIFIPMFQFQNSGEKVHKGRAIYCVVQLLLVICQYLGAAFTYIILPLKTKRFVRFWNRLQWVTSQVVILTSNRHFEKVYLATKWNFRIWLLSSLSFSLFTVYSYGEGYTVYMAEANMTVYTMFYIGFCVWPFMISWHIVHSMIVGSLTNVIKTNFTALIVHSKELRHTANPKDGIQRVFNLYEELNELTVEIGNIFGLYFAFEIIIMMICICANAFFLISNWGDFNYGLFVYSAIILPYLAWFHWICSSGQNVYIEGLKCRKEMRRLVLSVHAEDKMEWGMLPESPSNLTARHYFTINKTLFTSVVGTITTYLIVLLQFKVSSPNSDSASEVSVSGGGCDSHNVSQ